jgi:hypothetical protein
MSKVTHPQNRSNHNYSPLKTFYLVVFFSELIFAVLMMNAFLIQLPTHLSARLVLHGECYTADLLLQVLLSDTFHDCPLLSE